MRPLLAAAFACAASFGIVPAAASAQPADGVTATIELPRATMRAGSEMSGVVVVRNTTDRNVKITGCTSPFHLALRNSRFTQNVYTLHCRREFTLPPGLSRWPASVYADYRGCVGQPPLPPGVLLCDPDGSQPDLPPGKYRATLHQSDRVVADPRPVRVRIRA